jgi:hypothetical protein
MDICGWSDAEVALLVALFPHFSHVEAAGDENPYVCSRRSREATRI